MAAPLSALAATDELPELSGKTFLLGIGAQKAGTSWLDRYVRAHPDVAMTHMKEVHFFDARFRPRLFGNFHTRAVKRLREAVEKHQDSKMRLRRGMLERIDRVRMIEDDRAYLEMFARIAAPAKLVGEITPSYAALNAAAFTDIRRFLKSAGMTPRVVFLMRDPIERIYSAARMRFRDSGQPRGIRAQDIALRAMHEPSNIARGRYDRTIKALEAAFPPEELFIGFYETLFTEDTVEALCAFLGLSVIPADFGEVRNASPRDGDFTPEEEAQLMQMLRPVYRYCRRRFGDDLPEAWRKP
ncbi:sulfotransferase [Oceanibium sediminis]|uniref:sulfotransferase n=1 Tax=Oceanibium sediminis TaxID=2026339 RepID=UPI000DD3485E|nr:sulfotransferase [Oceanibium sediminis]